MEPLALQYCEVPHWPPLAWAADCYADSNRPPQVAVRHGPKVACHDDWFCEAIWDGDFAEGNFDQTSLIFGSGGRKRSDEIVFVPSGAPVDRLQYMSLGGRLLVSNSLTALLEATDAEVDPLYRHYLRDFNSITKGIRRYKRILRTSRGDVSILYFNNLKWRAGIVSEVDKPADQPDFDDFNAYYSYMQSAIHRLMRNAEARQRLPRLSALGTLSCGYDAATATTIASHCGLQAAITFPEQKDATCESAKIMAKCLGIELVVASRDGWRSTPLPEVPFLAPGGIGSEMYLAGVSSLLRDKALFTGFQGDVVWNKVIPHVSNDLRRNTPVGLSLMEFRLLTGFVHCPVPFLGIRNLKQINRISNQPEMDNWSIGSDYDRPICRRIVEDSGIPREAFGMHKSMASLIPRTLRNFTEASFEDYLGWLSEHSSKRFLDPLLERKTLLPVKVGARALSAAIRPAAAAVPKLQRPAKLLKTYAGREYLFRYVFPWAIFHNRTHYRCRPERG